MHWNGSSKYILALVQVLYAFLQYRLDRTLLMDEKLSLAR